MYPGVSKQGVHPPRRAVRPALVAALAALLLSYRPLQATTVKHLGLEEMVAASDTIVAGRVVSIRSYWQGKQIYTEVGVEVARALKGPRTDRLSFVQLGGRVEAPVPLEMTVPGAPIHRLGDEGYFFLQPGRAGEHIVVGLYQGRVPVHRDAQGEFVLDGGTRKSPAQFEEEIRRQLAGQKQDGSGARR